MAIAASAFISAGGTVARPGVGRGRDARLDTCLSRSRHDCGFGSAPGGQDQKSAALP
jgi:hypothetical protein